MKKRIKDIPIPSNEFYDEFRFRYRRCIEYFVGERKEETVFVKDNELEESMSQLISDADSRIIYFLGDPGIGKTMFLKNVLHITDNGVRLEEDKNMVVLSINFQGVLLMGDVEQFLINSIKGVCTALEDKFGFGERFYSDSGHMMFYDFIKSTKSSLLEYVTTTELIGKNEVEARKYRLTKAEEKDPYTYFSSRLKFYMSFYCERVRTIVIVADNVETIPGDKRSTVVRDVLALFSCILNASMKEPNGAITAKLLFSMRNDTYENICGDGLVSAYGPYSILYKRNPVDMGDFFKKRMAQAVISEEEAQIWNEAYEILLNLTYKFDGKYSTMIQNLCNYDFKSMKKCYKKVLTNKVWLLRGDRRDDFLNMSKTDYMFNNISVLRSIACGNNEVYRREKSVLTPNALLSDEFGDDSMVALLVLSFFDKRDSVIPKKKLKRAFQQVFADNKEIAQSLREVVTYFLDSKIIDQSDYMNEYTEKGEYLRITPRGKELWKMFVSDSVLLEMYREDHYFDDGTSVCNFVSSRKLMATLGQCEIFFQLLRFIEELFEKEKNLRELAGANGTLSEYYSCFGSKPQTKRLLEGVIKSIEYSGNLHNPDIQDKISELEIKMKNIEEIKAS